MNTPQHPALGQQQGLGQPVVAPASTEPAHNVYVEANPIMLQKKAQISGQAELDNAETFEAGKMAGLERGRAEVLNELAAQQADPVQELVGAIMNQQISREQLAQMNPRLVDEAMQMVNSRGLGAIQPQNYAV